MNKLVLLVEDDVDLGAVLVDTVASEGYRARLAVDGYSARAAVAEERPALVLLDWTLPDTDPEALAHDLTALGVPFVLASGLDEADDWALRVGAADVLRKPYDTEALLRVLGHFLGEPEHAGAHYS